MNLDWSELVTINPNLLSQLRSLSPEEKRAVVIELSTELGEPLLDEGAIADIERAWTAELDRRCADADANPDDFVDGDGFIKELRARAGRLGSDE